MVKYTLKMYLGIPKYPYQECIRRGVFGQNRDTAGGFRVKIGYGGGFSEAKCNPDPYACVCIMFDDFELEFHCKVY